MYIDIVPNRRSRPTVLIREAWRDGKKIRKRTIANITDWPEEKINALRFLLRGEPLMRVSEAITIERSLSCGHIRAILGIAEKIGLPAVISKKASLHRNIIMALVVEQLLHLCAPDLAEGVWSTTSLEEDTGLTGMTPDDLTHAIRRLCSRRPHIKVELESTNPSRNSLLSDCKDHEPPRDILIFLGHHLLLHLDIAMSPLLSDRGHQTPPMRPGYESNDPPAWTGCFTALHGNMHGSEQISTPGDILGHLASQYLITCRIKSIPGTPSYRMLTEPTPLQARVKDLIETYGETVRKGSSTWSSFQGPPGRSPGYEHAGVSEGTPCNGEPTEMPAGKTTTAEK